MKTTMTIHHIVEEFIKIINYIVDDYKSNVIINIAGNYAHNMLKDGSIIPKSCDHQAELFIVHRYVDKKFIIYLFNNISKYLYNITLNHKKYDNLHLITHFEDFQIIDGIVYHKFAEEQQFKISFMKIENIKKINYDLAGIAYDQHRKIVYHLKHESLHEIYELLINISKNKKELPSAFGVHYENIYNKFIEHFKDRYHN